MSYWGYSEPNNDAGHKKQPVNTISGSLFSHKDQSLEIVRPSHQFDASFKPADYKLQNVGREALRVQFQEFALRIVSTVSAGAQWMFYWLASAVNSASRDEPFELDGGHGQPSAYVRTQAVAIPNNSSSSSSGSVSRASEDAPNALQFSKTETVWPGDSILLTDGSIWQAVQPVICMWNGEPSVLAMKVGCIEVQGLQQDCCRRLDIKLPAQC
jgi:hypothetical protein